MNAHAACAALGALLWLASGRALAAPPPEACAAPAGSAAEGDVVDARELAPGLRVRLKYAVAGNFMGEAVYGPLEACWLQRDAARMLADAQRALERRRPGWSLLAFDCLRPRRVQRRMWSLVRGTPMQPYVARPDPGSLHNHGAAVDIGLADEAGRALDMGTPVDHFGVLAQPRHEERFLREGKLAEEQVANRRLLREVMREAGWRGLRHEWWHFEAAPVPVVRARWPVLEEFPRPCARPADPART